MIIDCISDLHGELPDLCGGDILILAGDYTGSDKVVQWNRFFSWLNLQQYSKKVLVAGNHDGLLWETFPRGSEEHRNLIDVQESLGIVKEFDYLCDTSTEFDGLKIWGSPWTPTFCNWHFMLDRGAQIRAKWDLIPIDVDILVTHGPSWSVLDKSNRCPSRCLGCQDLYEVVGKVKPKLHVFGHIHGSHGVSLLKHCGSDTLCVNASLMDENYEFTGKPIRVLWDGKHMMLEDK